MTTTFTCSKDGKNNIGHMCGLKFFILMRQGGPFLLFIKEEILGMPRYEIELALHAYSLWIALMRKSVEVAEMS